MSGGHWNYVGRRIQFDLDEIAEDENVLARFPRLGVALHRLGEAIYQIEHTIDWDLSYDLIIDDDAKFEREALDDLAVAVRGLEKER